MAHRSKMCEMNSGPLSDRMYPPSATTPSNANHSFSIDKVIYHGRQLLLRVLVDDVESFENVSILSLIELEVHCPGDFGINWVTSFHSDVVTCSLDVETILRFMSLDQVSMSNIAFVLDSFGC